jgi:hypothetical protein
MDDEQQLLDIIPLDGSPVGNTTLIRELGWDAATYWDVRNRLVDRGVIEIGRGRGGSVRRRVVEPLVPAPTTSPTTPSLESEPPPAVDQRRPREDTLYQPIARVLEERWVRDRRFESAIVQVTANLGSRATGGKWSRPDIAVATLSTYPYVPGRHFDVVTFEVKPADAINVTAVYEALAHLRAATRAYVLLHVPDPQRAVLDTEIDEVTDVAKKHGVGVITFSDPSNYDTWEELVESERTEPDPQRLNDFLATQFTSEQRERLVRWFR